jgi:hypothetical protein
VSEIYGELSGVSVCTNLRRIFMALSGKSISIDEELDDLKIVFSGYLPDGNLAVLGLKYPY